MKIDTEGFPGLVNVLVVGAYPDITSLLVRLVNRFGGIKAEGATGAWRIISQASAQNYDLVLIGSGLNRRFEDRVILCARSRNPDVKIIYHFGGGSGLLKSELSRALGFTLISAKEDCSA